jgi:hypothetical protein
MPGQPPGSVADVRAADECSGKGMRVAIVRAACDHCLVSELPENTVESREQSLQLQLQGVSQAATKAEAERGVEAARADLESGYGVGFGFIKSFGSPDGLDGVKLLYAVVADDGRQANIHVVVTGTALATLGYARFPNTIDASLAKWILECLHRKAGSIAASHDRYARLLEQHPIYLSSLEATG